jgi:hypothetical protein
MTKMSPRAAAIAEGRKTYWKGEPCKHGHHAERYTRSGHCVECLHARNARVSREWRAANPERVKELNRRTFERDPGYSVRNRRKHWAKVYARRRADPNRRLAHDLRAAIANQVRHGKAKKASSTAELLGCSIVEFRSYIEGLWLDGMTWENWGREKGCWHLDHRRPIASFDLTDTAQQRECFHFTNYQPLWAEDNVRKGAKWAPDATPMSVRQ